MPKISQTHRILRQQQILSAAWRCVHRSGVQAATIDEIIRESRLPASAMYRYFTGKDDIIMAAITSSLTEFSVLLEPLLLFDRELSPPDLIRAITRAITQFTARDGFDLCSLALHGWSEAQRNPRIRRVIRSFYRRFRERLGERVLAWQADGRMSANASAKDLAATLMAIVLGFVAQRVLLGGVTADAVARGIASLPPDYQGLRKT
jgi:TetR/AcrR family transcriptional regulator, transcriptional repressor of aconitase